MRHFEELKIRPSSADNMVRSLEDSDFVRFEALYGIEIPDGLQALLRFCNGGHPELDCVEASGHLWSLNRFYHLAGTQAPGSLEEAIVRWRTVLGPRALPFAGDAGGNQFYLDLRSGCVGVCLHDEEMERVEVASSFECFIDGLHVGQDMI